MITDLLLIICVLLVAVGAGMIYLPAGLIVGGVLGIFGCLLFARATPPRPERDQ